MRVRATRGRGPRGQEGFNHIFAEKTSGVNGHVEERATRMKKHADKLRTKKWKHMWEKACRIRGKKYRYDKSADKEHAENYNFAESLVLGSGYPHHPCLRTGARGGEFKWLIKLDIQPIGSGRAKSALDFRGKEWASIGKVWKEIWAEWTKVGNKWARIGKVWERSSEITISSGCIIRF